MKYFIFVCQMIRANIKVMPVRIKHQRRIHVRCALTNRKYVIAYLLGEFRVGISDFSHYETDKLNEVLRMLLEQCDDKHFKPLTDKNDDGCVDHGDIALITRLSAELTSRYLLSGF